jgi:pimeloyl-ACP methyl ester carboxylesterase
MKLLLRRLLHSALPAAAVFLLSGFPVSLSGASVNYTLTGKLSRTSGTDPLGINGATVNVLVTIDSAKTPSSFVTTATSSKTVYQNPASTRLKVATGAVQTCANPGVTMFLTDNVSTAADGFQVTGCTLPSSAFAVNVQVPAGRIITAIPSSFPQTSVTGSLAYTVPGSTAKTVFSLTTATLVATGAAPPAVTPNPLSWSPSVVQGSTTPLTQAISLGASAPVSYRTAVSGGTWLSVQPAAGNTATSLTVTANPTGLSAGIYSGSVTLTYGQGITGSVPVTLTITAIPTLSVGPSSLSFSGYIAGVNPPSQTLAVTSSPTSVSLTATSNLSWLSVSPGSSATPSSLTVSVNTAGMLSGTYNGAVTITAPGTTNSPVVVPVSLTLSAVPDPQPDPNGPQNIFYGGIPPNPNAPVLLFVHGLGANAYTWFVAGNDMYNTAYYAGYRTAFISLSADNSQNSEKISTNGPIIESVVPFILQHYGVSQVHFICHSKGGLDLQWAMWDSPVVRASAKTVFMLGSPNQGAQLADWAFGPGSGIAGRLGLLTPGLEDLEVATVAAYRANFDPVLSTAGIPLYTLAGSSFTGNAVTIITGPILKNLSGEANDGLVAVTESRLNPAWSIDLGTTPHNHFDLNNGTISFPMIKPYLPAPAAVR